MQGPRVGMNKVQVAAGPAVALQRCSGAAVTGYSGRLAEGGIQRGLAA